MKILHCVHYVLCGTVEGTFVLEQGRDSASCCLGSGRSGGPHWGLLQISLPFESLLDKCGVFICVQ